MVARLLVILGFLACLPLSVSGKGGLVWPTPNRAWSEGLSPSRYVQPTVSGRVESAFFGCVRNDGRRFHEGIDLAPVGRDRRGEATDPVFAVMDGTVRYVNRIAGNSGYGHYVVIEHDEAEPPVVTLYAHLAEFRDGIEKGKRVMAGQALGRMGRSAGGYTIPRERAHLHFEIGFWVSEEFEDWYEWRGYTTRNRHGNFSGLNMIGINPVEFYDEYRAGNVRSVLEYVESQPEAFALKVRSDKIPDFVRRYPQLLSRPWIPSNLEGWEIGFTWYGLPKRWRALGGDEWSWEGDGRVQVLSYDRGLLARNSCRNTVLVRGDEPIVGSHTERTLQLLFGFR